MHDQGILNFNEQLNLTFEQPKVCGAMNANDHGDIFDAITGAKLDWSKGREARSEEMSYMKKLNVRTFEPRSVCEEETGQPPLPTGWVDQNKGNDEDEDYRSRFVVRETKRMSTIEAGDAVSTFAATPPLEGPRLLISQCMSGRNDLVMGFIDISRAHLSSPTIRKIFVEPPPEDKDGPAGYCWKFNNSICGQRDAGKAFDLNVENIMS